MVFLPPPRTQASPRAQMLAGDLARAIEDFRRRYPDTSDGDVQAGLQLAAAVHARPSPARVLAVVLGLALALGAGLLVFILGDTSIGRSEVLLIAGKIVFVLLIGGLLWRQGRG